MNNTEDAALTPEQFEELIRLQILEYERTNRVGRGRPFRVFAAPRRDIRERAHREKSNR